MGWAGGRAQEVCILGLVMPPRTKLSLDLRVFTDLLSAVRYWRITGDQTCLLRGKHPFIHSGVSETPEEVSESSSLRSIANDQNNNNDKKTELIENGSSSCPLSNLAKGGIVQLSTSLTQEKT